MKVISEDEFIAVAQREQCRANLDERRDAISPSYVQYSILAQAILTGKTYPPWRTDKDGSWYVGAYEVPRGEAFPISYIELSKKPHLFDAVRFDATKNYLTTRGIITFHCMSCGVRVVKDGNHRLLQCVLHKLNPELEVYEVMSQNWSAGKVDMKNFCECISDQLSHPSLGSGASRQPSSG